MSSRPGQGRCVVFLGKVLLFNLTVPLSIEEYKWVLANCEDIKLLEVTCDGLELYPEGG